MNIYFYLKHFPPEGAPLIGGTATSVSGLATNLVTFGCNVTILCEGKRSSNYVSPKGYRIVCFKQNRSRIPFSISSHLKVYLKDLVPSPDLIVLNGMFNPSVFRLAHLLAAKGLPYIVSPHDPYNPPIFSKKVILKYFYWYIWERRLLQKAKGIQVLDKRHGVFLKKLGINSPIIEIPNGYSPEEIPKYSAFDIPNQEREIRLFFLGRLDAHNKGLDLLIEAFSKIRKDIKARLTIQGQDWGDKKALQAYTEKLSIKQSVHFLDADFNTMPSSIISRHDIFCLVSRFEGFGLSALEAMLAGRVLLISENAGIASHVEAAQCGVLVKSEVSSIYNGLQTLVTRKNEWKEMGANGRKYAIENLTWKKVARKALLEYEKVAL